MQKIKMTQGMVKLTKAKYETNWKEKSLENLEKDFWQEPVNESHLVKTCLNLRKKPLSEFEIADLRIMIGQNIGLKYLVPIALDKLKNNILAEGSFYEGDLLKSVLSCHADFWKNETELKKELESIVTDNQELLKAQEVDLLKTFNEWKTK